MTSNLMNNSRLSTRWIFGSFILATVVITLITACRREPHPNDIQPEMRNIYSVVSELYSYAWSPKRFRDSKSEVKIQKLLDRLAEDFHRVEVKAPLPSFEPGFRITLQTQQDLIRDARTRFTEGKKDYANWRLRGLMTNCIACHSRYQVPIDFIGDIPSSEDTSAEGHIARAEFLFSTRQFDESKKHLLDIIEAVDKAEAGWCYAFQALQLLLLIEVRVKDNSLKAAATLQHILERSRLTPYGKEILQAWIEDLEELAHQEALSGQRPETLPLNRARALLAPVWKTSSIQDDDRHLVTTLKATSLLHPLLQQQLPAEDRRKATFLLSLAYYHLQIASFDTLKALYLEQCIREFPQTDEAQRAYLLYVDLIESMSMGSAGLFLETDQQQKLRQLRSLAFGTPPLILQDMFPQNK